MTDPLSIAASVAGLALLARDVAKGIKEVKSALRGSGTELTGLYNGVISLYSVLQGAQLVMEQMDDYFLRDTEPGDIVFACNDTFEAIHKLLKKDNLDLKAGFASTKKTGQDSLSVNAKGRWGTLKQATRWYLNKEEVAKLCADLESHKTKLALAMSRDSMTALVEVLKSQNSMSRHLHDMRKIQAEIRAGQIQESKRQLNEKQARMMKDFSDVEPQEAQRKHLQLRQPGTGTWFLEGPHFQSFLSNDNSSLLLYGIPGAGKSVLSATVSEFINDLRTRNVAAAFFFCEHDYPETQGARNILASLAKQLAIQNDDAFSKLEAFHKEHTSFEKFSVDSRSMLNLLWDLSKTFDTTLIVVDGLDECLEDRTEMVQILSELSNPDEGSIKTLFTSRDESDIRNNLAGFQNVEIEAAKSDVRLHVAAQLESPRFRSISTSNTGLKEEILQYLVENSSGMFQWVKCQLDYLHSLPSNGMRRKALKQLPPDLPRTYERILLRAKETARGVMLSYLERTLRWIAFAARPLSVTEMSHAIAVEQGDVIFDDPMDMEKILCHYNSLIREDDGILTFSHFSVKEFLMTINPDAGPLARFQLDESYSHGYLAEICLTYLLLEQFDQDFTHSREKMCGALDENPFYRYASHYWNFHARNSAEALAQLSSLVNQLFEPQKSNKFVLWAYCWMLHYVNVGAPDELHSQMADVNPLHLACLCGLSDVIDSLIRHGQDVNQRSFGFGTPLDCIGGACVLVTQEKGLPRPEDLTKAAERLLQENVMKDSSRCSAVRGAIFHDNAPLLVTLLEAGCPLTTNDISLAMGVGSDSIIHALRQAVEKRTLDPEFELPESYRLLAFGIPDHSGDDGRKIHHSSTPDIILPHLEDEYRQMMKSAAEKGQLSRINKMLSGLQSLTGKRREALLSDLVLDASRNGHTEVVEYLVREGADIFFKNPMSGSTALHGATGGRHSRLVQHLLKLSPEPRQIIELEDNDGFTPWMQAIIVGSMDILKMFLEVDPLLNLGKTTKTGFTAVHFAAQSKNRPMFLFMQERGLDITRAADNGSIPLHIILSNGRGELELPGEFARFVINTFLDKENDVNRKGAKGINTLHFLFYRAEEESTRLIWQAIANEPRFKASRATALRTITSCIDGQTPLHDLMEAYGNTINTPSATVRITEILQSVCSLEETKAALAIRNSEGQTPLLFLIKILSTCDFPATLRRTQPDVFAKGIRVLIEADEQDHCLNAEDTGGRTVLHWIAKCTTTFPFREIAKLVLQYPVNPLARDHDGATPLEIALSNKEHNFDLFRCLMEGASETDLEIPGKDGKSILHIMCALRKDSVEDLISLYLSNIALSTSRDDDGRIPLMYTPEVISTPSLAYQLIDFAKENVKIRDDEGFDVLSHACRTGSTVVVEALIQHGMNIDEARGVEGSEEPPIIVAAESRKVEVVQLLLNSGADPYARGSVGDQLHHWAVTRGRQQLQDIVETLEGFDYNEQLSAGWSIVIPGEEDKSVTYMLFDASPLHIAASNEDSQALRWLLEPPRRPRDLDQETGRGETALFVAACLGHLTNCKTLVSAGATVSKARADGCTAFHIACQYGHTGVCDFLLSVDENLAFTAADSGTPLQAATRGGHVDVVRLLLSKDIEIPDGLEMEALGAGRRDIAELIQSKLQEKRCQQTEMNTWTEREINTLKLRRVCGEGDEEALLDLLEAGIYPNRRLNTCGETALHIASRKGWTDAIEALIEEGAEVDSLDWQMKTPLLYAADVKNWEVVEMLHTLGARLDSLDHQGWSVLHSASNNPEMIAYCIENGSDVTSISYLHGTPLTRTTDPVCTELLLQNGCDPFATIASHASAISEICGRSNAEESLRSILSERPTKRMFEVIDLRDLEIDSTPLHNAAFGGIVGNMLALIEHGADVNLPGGRFGTPYQAALKQGHVKALTLLAENGARPCMVIRDGQERAAWFWEHGGQFSFPALDGTWVPTSLPLESKKPPRRIRANDARKGRYWEHGYRFSFQNQRGAWIMA